MKAAVFKQPGFPLVIEEVNDPEPGPDDLILKVRACGICGTDLHWSQGNDPSAGWRHLTPGSVMGHEFSGEIIELGKMPVVSSVSANGSWHSPSSAVVAVVHAVPAVLIVVQRSSRGPVLN
jgi:threonine dehydrogenase-like Zn-dependent dehydrogenase